MILCVLSCPKQQNHIFYTCLAHNAALVKTQEDECSGQSGVVRCFWESRCRFHFGFGAVCVYGFCQCPNSSAYDTCTCLRKSYLSKSPYDDMVLSVNVLPYKLHTFLEVHVHMTHCTLSLASVGQCTIELDAESPVGMPSYNGEDATPTYSCIANSTCNYNLHAHVHVLSCYEAIGHEYPTGQSVVDITATGQSSRPIVLVLVSYKQVEWILNVSSHIVIDTVIVVSCLSHVKFDFNILETVVSAE